MAFITTATQLAWDIIWTKDSKHILNWALQPLADGSSDSPSFVVTAKQDERIARRVDVWLAHADIESAVFVVPAEDGRRGTWSWLEVGEDTKIYLDSTVRLALLQRQLPA